MHHPEQGVKVSAGSGPQKALVTWTKKTHEMTTESQQKHGGPDPWLNFFPSAVYRKRDLSDMSHNVIEY